MFNSLFRAVSGFFRYIRPLINGAGLLLLLAVLVRAVVEPFVPHRDEDRSSDPQARNLKPIVPVLEIRKIRETQPAPDRVMIRVRDVADFAGADMAFGLDSLGNVLDSFPLRPEPESPRLQLPPILRDGAFEGRTAKVARKARVSSNSGPERIQTMAFPAEFEGSFNAQRFGKLRQIRFRVKGTLTTAVSFDDGYRLRVMPLGNNSICGRFLVINSSGKEYRSVRFRTDLLDSLGGLVRSGTGEMTVSQIGGNDSVVVDRGCAQFELDDYSAVRYVRIKAIEAQVERRAWERLLLR